MTLNEPIPCPNCQSIKYFEGLCYDCKQAQKRLEYESLTEQQVHQMIRDIIENITTIDN